MSFGFVLENALVRCADFCKAYRCRNDRLQDGQVLPKIFFYRPDGIPAEVGFIGHRQEHAADFQSGIDLPLDLLYGADQLRHVLCRQIIRLDRDCLLYTSPSPRDAVGSRMPSSA